jgi:hypothetical protein
MYDWKPIKGVSETGWYGFDFDGVLATYTGWNGGRLGDPIWPMVERVKRLLAKGKEVRIFTARVGECEGVSPESGKSATKEFIEDQHKQIQEWCEKYIGRKLKVTATKDYGMICLYDDRAYRVIMNEGRLCCGNDEI